MEAVVTEVCGPLIRELEISEIDGAWRQDTGEGIMEIVPEAIREAAHREAEIARLMGPSDDYEQRWLDYCEALVKMTDEYIAAQEDGEG